MNKRFRGLLPIRPVLSGTVLLLAGVLIATDPLLAQAPANYQPPTLTFPENRISLIEAIRLTLQHEPNIKLSEQSSLFQKGIAQEQTGRFDATIFGDASFNFTQQELRASEKKAESNRRKDIQDVIDELKASADDALKSLTEAQNLQADPTGFRVSDPATQAQIDTYNRLIVNTADPAQKAQYTKIRDDLIAASVQAFQSVYTSLRNSENEQRQNLADLGPIPKVNQDYLAKLDLSISKPFRDGVTLGLFERGSWERHRFRGKPKREELGGKGLEDLYKIEVGFSVDAFLLRGRGSASTGAFERSALIDFEASIAAIKHAAATSVLNTIAAYWSLVGAQESLEIARQSAALQSKRVEVSRALIEGDELPKSELSRVLASEATDRGLVSGAERAVQEARIALARAIGLNVEDNANAPLAADPFPTPPDPPVLNSISPSQLVAGAVARRYDHQAALQLQQSGGVLAEAARLDLRPQLDLHSELSTNTITETSLEQSGRNFAAPGGVLALNFSKPIGNNVFKGRLLQREAVWSQRAISAADLERTIKANVVSELRSLQDIAEQVRRAKESVGFYRTTIDAENERFRLGDSTLIDTILTQDLQTGALFTYASAKQQYATLLAQLRFETGTLVSEETSGSIVHQENLLTLPPVEPGAPAEKPRR